MGLVPGTHTVYVSLYRESNSRILIEPPPKCAELHLDHRKDVSEVPVVLLVLLYTASVAGVLRSTHPLLFSSFVRFVFARFAWAIPDERALRIMEHFGPIVEVSDGALHATRSLHAHLSKRKARRGSQGRLLTRATPRLIVSYCKSLRNRAQGV